MENGTEQSYKLQSVIIFSETVFHQACMREALATVHMVSALRYVRSAHAEAQRVTDKAVRPSYL